MPQVNITVCPVCKTDVTVVYYGFEEKFPNVLYDKYDVGKLCDYADSDGCFKIYHEQCLPKHSCPAHKRKR